MSLRIDSWKYPLETLDGRKPEVRALGEWLQLHKPRLSRPSATNLSTKIMQGTPFRPNDLQRIIGKANSEWPITPELLRLLNDAHTAYAPERAARAAYLRELNGLRSQIPWADRERMRPIAERHYWLNGADASVARLGISGCEFWLAINAADRRAWFKRVEANLADLAAKHERETNEAFEQAKTKYGRETNEAFEQAKTKYGREWLRDILTGASSGDFQALGLPSTATASDIKTAFRRLAKKHHPDAGGDPSKFMEVQAAYERLVKVAS
jgi:hypothetical protein